MSINVSESLEIADEVSILESVDKKELNLDTYCCAYFG